MTETVHHIIGADGAWLGSSPRLVIAEAIRAIYPGAIIASVDRDLVTLVTA